MNNKQFISLEKVYLEKEHLIYKYLYPSVVTWCKDTREELYQRCRIRLWNSLKTYDPQKCKINTFVYMVVRATLNLFLAQEIYHYNKHFDQRYFLLAFDRLTIRDNRHLISKADTNFIFFDDDGYGELREKLIDLLTPRRKYSDNCDKMHAEIPTLDTIEKEVNFFIDFLKAKFDKSKVDDKSFYKEFQKKYRLDRKQIDNSIQRIKGKIRKQIIKRRLNDKPENPKLKETHLKRHLGPNSRSPR